MEILSYFARNPQAADSLEGIARWRLLDEIIDRKLNETQAALDWLVDHGLLEKAEAGRKAIFRLNPERAAETKQAVATRTIPGLTLRNSEMPSVLIDSMDTPGLWTALAPDGVTPSLELQLAVNSNRRPNAQDLSAKITASANSVGHTLRRTIPALDLTKFDELRMWTYSDRLADGSAQRPLFLEMRVASAAMPLSHPGNTWKRYLPVTQAKVWAPARFTITDLPAAIRGAVTQIQFRSAAAGAAFQCCVDDLIAASDRMIGDVDAALLSHLHNTLTLGAAAVPAVLHSNAGPVAQARPYFEITHYDIVYARERTGSTQPRGDYSLPGVSLRQPGNAFELYYQITAMAANRPDQAQMLEFVLRALPARGELSVNGFGLPMESIRVEAIDQPGGIRTDTIPLFYKVSTRQDTGVTDAVMPVSNLILEGDLLT